MLAHASPCRANAEVREVNARRRPIIRIPKGVTDMRARRRILLVATGALLSSFAGAALDQGWAVGQGTAVSPGAPAGNTKTVMTVAELFSKAKPGMWLRLEGTPQPDQTIRCTKARLITGSIEDNDWQIRGQIRGVEAASRQLTVGSYRVKLQAAPKFLPVTTLHGIADLKVGMYIRVVGTYTPDGGFVARKVEDQTAEVAQKTGGDKRVVNQGKVERVDPTRKAIVLMGTTYVLSPDTKATAVVMM